MNPNSQFDDKARKGLLVLTQGETSIHHPAPEREGEIAGRESLDPEGVGQCHRQRTASLANAQNGLTGRRDAHLFAAMQLPQSGSPK